MLTGGVDNYQPLRQATVFAQDTNSEYWNERHRTDFGRKKNHSRLAGQ